MSLGFSESKSAKSSRMRKPYLPLVEIFIRLYLRISVSKLLFSGKFRLLRPAEEPSVPWETAPEKAICQKESRARRDAAGNPGFHSLRVLTLRFSSA